MGSLIILVGFGSALAYFPLQIYAALRLKGLLRWVALLPTLVMVPVFGVTISALRQDSNLWPIVMIFVSPLASMYLIGLIAWGSMHARN